MNSDELAEIYIKRGVDHPLARQVAQQLMAKDALSTHTRDELGISDITAARPVQAALTSAAMFSLGAAMPLIMVVVSPAGFLVPLVSAAVIGLSRSSGRGRGKSRWGKHAPCDSTRNFLGRAGNGSHCRYRKTSRHGCLNRSVCAVQAQGGTVLPGDLRRRHSTESGESN